MDNKPEASNTSHIQTSKNNPALAKKIQEASKKIWTAERNYVL